MSIDKEIKKAKKLFEEIYNNDVYPIEYIHEHAENLSADDHQLKEAAKSWLNQEPYSTASGFTIAMEAVWLPFYICTFNDLVSKNLILKPASSYPLSGTFTADMEIEQQHHDKIKRFAENMPFRDRFCNIVWADGKFPVQLSGGYFIDDYTNGHIDFYTKINFNHFNYMIGNGAYMQGFNIINERDNELTPHFRFTIQEWLYSGSKEANKLLQKFRIWNEVRCYNININNFNGDNTQYAERDINNGTTNQ